MMPLAVITGFAVVTLYVLSQPGSSFQVTEKERERMLGLRAQREQVLNELATLRVGGQVAGEGQGRAATGTEGAVPVALVSLDGEEETVTSYMEQMNELAARMGEGDHLMRVVDLSEPETDELFVLDEEEPELQLEVPKLSDRRRGYPYLAQLNELAAKHPEGLCKAVDLTEPTEETRPMDEEIDIRELEMVRRPNRLATRARKSYRDRLARLNRQAERKAA